MYYKTPTLIARKNALGGWGDTVKSIGGSIFNVFSAGEQAKGAAATLAAQQQMALMQQQQGLFGGPSGSLLLLGALGIGVVLILKKKKSAQ